MTISEKTLPNRLFQVMIGLSVLVHLVLLVYIAGIYRSESLTVIEMSVADMPDPSGRVIPRPRRRPEPPSIKEPALSRARVPQIALPVEAPDLPSSLMESMAVPTIPAESLAGLSDLTAADGRGLFSQKDYFEMVRMKIERAKTYPESARSRMIEGRVTVRFTITPDGQATGLSIVRHSGRRDLDQAALDAVMNAAPFSPLPRALFTGPLQLELTVCFELT
jgi:protein TonB